LPKLKASHQILVVLGPELATSGSS